MACVVLVVRCCLASRVHIRRHQQCYRRTHCREILGRNEYNRTNCDMGAPYDNILFEHRMFWEHRFSSFQGSGIPPSSITLILDFLLTPYFLMVIACLCVGIRHSFIDLLTTDLPVVYESYSSARISIAEVSRAIVYPAMATLIICLYSNFVVAFWFSRHGLAQDGFGIFAQFILPIMILYILAFLTYPSFLLNRGDTKMREIVVNSNDRENASVLACLFLDGDDACIRFFGLLFNKYMLTFWSRVIYMALSYLLLSPSVPKKA